MKRFWAAAMNLTIDQLLQRWNHCIKRGTLANWRSQGSGPAFIKVGRAVLYPLDKVVEWETKQK